jgi:hypothetical protein
MYDILKVQGDPMNTNPEDQFNFWIGDWDLTWGDGEEGKNSIAKIMNGKIIQENFTSPTFNGMSVSAYDPERKVWCQTWVDDNGSYLDFTGGFEENTMILSRNAVIKGVPCKQRMVWFNIHVDHFDWKWERSDDEGQTWNTLWYIHYKRRKE